ncbi:urease accessory protein UreE [Kineococcus terrestris]|uniref:urease accessory protein UreE n=1 Tax=Kineococcus terrestris TaxID=2044856 RepID=UPI0034DB5F2F
MSAASGSPELPAAPTTLTAVLGHEDDPGTAEALHALRHAGAVEVLHVDEADAPRRRLRVVSDRGREYAVALPRGTGLVDGAVLHLDPASAVVVRTRAAQRLRLRAADPAAALRLGFLAGHLHWTCETGDGVLDVVVQGRAEDHLARVADLLAAGAVTLEDP